MSSEIFAKQVAYENKITRKREESNFLIPQKHTCFWKGKKNQYYYFFPSKYEDKVFLTNFATSSDLSKPDAENWEKMNIEKI
jgi:hypothetical protein